MVRGLKRIVRGQKLLDERGALWNCGKHLTDQATATLGPKSLIPSSAMQTAKMKQKVFKETHSHTVFSWTSLPCYVDSDIFIATHLFLDTKKEFPALSGLWDHDGCIKTSEARDKGPPSYLRNDVCQCCLQANIQKDSPFSWWTRHFGFQSLCIDFQYSMKTPPAQT